MPHLVLPTARWRAAAIVLALLSVPATALAIEVTGGLPNQLVHIYYLPVVAGALFLPRKWSILVTCLAVLLTCPLVDYVHLWLNKPLFYKNSSMFNFAGSGWIVRPLAFAFINLVASRVRQSIDQLAASNATLRIEVAERVRTEQRLETALQAEFELEAQLEHQAFHDALTGLANRATFKSRLDHALEMAQASGRSVGLLFLDVDDFKAVNDRWGHATGDEVLAELGNRIGRCCVVSETPARLGGDEFAVIIEEPVSTDAIVSFAQRVMETLERPVTFAHGELFLHCSLGIAVADDQNRASGTELLRQADIAMYTAKSNGKARIDIFESSIAVDLVERIALAQDMQRAVLRDELVLHYQPIVSLANSEIIGFEALVRWDHPRLGLLSPDRFIAVAEENGTIRELGAWVLNRAAEQLVVWREATQRDLLMAVNVSARQLAMPSFVDDVEGALESRPIPAHRLVLEITESVLMADAAQSLTRLHDLKELGVQIAVDDFGTGYSSLNYLRRFPVDVLKIDKAFVDEIADQFSKDTALVHTIIEIGRILGLEVVAEGIEHAVQVDALRDLGCEIGQGYHFARPTPAAEIGKLLSKQAISAA